MKFQTNKSKYIEKNTYNNVFLINKKYMSVLNIFYIFRNLLI